MKNKKNKKEGLISKKEFLIIFLAILILSGISYWNFKKSEKALPFFEIEKKQMENLEIPDLPSFEAPSLTPSSYSQYLFPEIPDSIMPKTEPEYSKKKTFISPDGNLKIIYPSEWLEIKITDIQKKTVEGLQWDFLFFARKFGEEKFGLLNVFKIIVPAETEKEQLFEEIKKKLPGTKNRNRNY